MVFKFVGLALTNCNKFGGGVSGSFINFSLEVLEQSREFTNLQEVKLAVCLRQASYM